MERLFTNITNEELTQNNNDLHTGCYAGEREDFIYANKREECFDCLD